MADTDTQLILTSFLFGWVFLRGMLFQSSFLFLAGFVLQGCSLLLVALGALGDTPLLITTLDFLLVGSFCFSLSVFLSCSLALQTLSQGHRCPRTHSNLSCSPPAAMEKLPEHRPVPAVHSPSSSQCLCNRIQPGGKGGAGVARWWVAGSCKTMLYRL